jgi:hypothetical protein
MHDGHDVVANACISVSPFRKLAHHGRLDVGRQDFNMIVVICPGLLVQHAQNVPKLVRGLAQRIASVWLEIEHA